MIYEEIIWMEVVFIVDVGVEDVSKGDIVGFAKASSLIQIILRMT
jgi:hypothetical protein